MTISDFITSTMPQLMASQISNSGCYVFRHLYEQVRETAIQMLQDGLISADHDFIAAEAVRIIDKHDGKISVRELSQELNSILLPGDHVEHNYLIQLDLTPYTIVEKEEDDYTDGDNDFCKVIKHSFYNDYKPCPNSISPSKQ